MASARAGLGIQAHAVARLRKLATALGRADQVEGSLREMRHHEQEAITAATTLPQPGSDAAPEAELVARRDWARLATHYADRAQAAESLGTWRLTDCTLYVTLEPCPMCAGAIVQARIPLVVYATTDPKAGACHSLYSITDDPRLNHRCVVLSGVLAADGKALLQEFFAKKRAMGKK